MLILTRRRNQQIEIGDNVFVRFLEIDSSEAKVGIIAPSTLPIIRTEMRPEAAEAIRKRRLRRQPAVKSDNWTTPYSRVAEKVCIHLERGNFEAAVEVIRRFEEAEQASRSEGEKRTILDETPFAGLDLDLRVINALENAGLVFVGDLWRQDAEWTVERLMGIRNLGRTQIERLLAVLSNLGVVVRYSTPPAS